MPDVDVAMPEAQALAARLLEAVGVPPEPAASTATALALADAWGVGSHGLMRMPLYLRRLRAGGITADARLTAVSDVGGLAVYDGGAGLGHWQARRAVEEATRRARSHGIAAVAVGNSSHCGALGAALVPAAEAGLLGVLVSNGPPAVAPPGSSSALLSTSPIAATLPTSPTVTILDLSLSATTRGTVFAHHAAGEPLPEGWAMDDEGRPTTDPSAALAGMLAPLGGTKGYALALLVEALTGAAVGPTLSADVVDIFDAARAHEPQGIAHTAIAIDPAALAVDGGSAVRFEDLTARIEAAGARLPGAARLRHAAGEAPAVCALAASTVEALRSEARALGVSLPDALADPPRPG